MMSKSHPRFSVVVPVYNTATSLVALSQRVKTVFEETLKQSYELIFVNDGSPNPETWPALERICAEDPCARAIALSRNFGQAPATVCGLAAARGDHVITMDDDLQHRPEDIALLVENMSHDVVVGKLRHKKHSPFKRLASWMKAGFDRVILGKPRGIHLSSFRLLSRLVVDGMLKIHTPFPFIPALMFFVTKDIVNVDVEHQPRIEGRTGYSLVQMLRLFSNLIINNSSLLLRLLGYLGGVISFFSLGLGIYFVVRKLFFGVGVMGWTSMIVSILFMGGLMLFAIGVLGEYLLRIINGVEQKPTFLVRHEIGEGRPSGQTR